MKEEKETKELLKDHLKSLPENIQQTITAVNYEIKLQEIVKRQKLLIDQGAQLEIETTLVMIGLEPLKNYIRNLRENLKVSEAKAQEIALDANENIFKPIRETLEEINKEMEETRIPEEVAPTIPKESPPRFTDSNEAELNRDQILKEIEDPTPNRSVVNNIPQPESAPTPEIENDIQIRPVHELEIKPAQELKTIPGEVLKNTTSIHETKLTSPTINNQQVVEAKPETKLPEINKSRPSHGADPYREPLI